MTTTLAGCCYVRKRYVANPAFGHAEGMKSDLQKLFVRRLGEEMDVRAMSDNGLAKLARTIGHEIGQTTISAIRRGKQDPSLEKVNALADALGVPAWALFMEAGHIEQRVIRPAALPKNVVKLANPYPPMLRRSDDVQPKKVSKRKR
jgi:transcriptional regulator with XRE-family HTH domain